MIVKNKIFYSFFAEDKRLSKIKVNECKYRKYAIKMTKEDRKTIYTSKLKPTKNK